MESSDKTLDKKVFWIIPGVLGIFLYLNMYVSSFFNGVETFSLSSVFMFICRLYLFWFISSWILNRERKLTLTGFSSSIIIVTLVSIGWASAFKQYLIVSWSQNDSIGWIHLVNYGTEGVIIAFSVTMLAMLVHIMNRQQKILVENAELEKAAVKAQLHALQTQINPHFLFNNLNTLQSMIPVENTDALDYLKTLADLFREMLTNRDIELIPLEQELEFSRLFIHLLKGRFKDSFSVDIQLEENSHYYIPPFTVQMLLENIIKHNRLDDTHKVNCYIIQSGATLLIKNNQHQKHDVGYSAGLGLENLKRRYALLSDKVIKISSDAQFEVTIPLLRVSQYD